MAITVNGLQIDDNVNYIVEEVTYRSIPTRDIKTAPLSRRPGDKLTAAEWKQKAINIKGRVFSSTPSDLRTRVDTLQQNFAVQSLVLAVDSDRSYTATLTKLDIPTQFYNNSMVQFDADFLAVDPFAYGTQLTASGTVVSGTVTFSGSLNVSGTVFAEPTLTINPTGLLAGDSAMKVLQFTYSPTGETISISGTINYLSNLVFDFKNFLVTNSGVNSDYTGIFSRFGPGVINYTVSVTTGAHGGFNYTWAYQPRYYE